MPINHCRHIKEDGVFCQAPPLHGRDYCRFHIRTLGRRIRMARALAQRTPYRLVLPILEDMNAVHVALQQVMDALAAGLVDQKLGGRLLYGLQQASSNLRNLTAAPRLGVYDEQTDTGPRAEDYPGFEEEFDLPAGLDLSQPPEVLFPPAAAAEVAVMPSPYRRKPFDRDEIAPEDVELEEIYRTQGLEAYQLREHELNQKAFQRVMERKREVERARYVVEAARRNTERIVGTPEELARNKAEVEKMYAEERAQRRANLEAAAGVGSDAGKKPAAAQSVGEAEAVTGPTKKSGA